MASAFSFLTLEYLEVALLESMGAMDLLCFKVLLFSFLVVRAAAVADFFLTLGFSCLSGGCSC